tara:strand:+ start:1069 stop:1290 length:222 start_codon:yes stop_codon:yes gene_type:complete
MIIKETHVSDIREDKSATFYIMIMKKTKYKVEMYYGDEESPLIRETYSIDEARQWVNECEHGVILNAQGIAVQ